MSDIVLTLGDFVFDGEFEVPEHIPAGGGEQRLNIHELVGDARQIDAMGFSPAPIGWTGRFRGADAQDRSRAVEAILKAGRPVVLTWHEYAFTVVVQRYLPDMLNAFEVPYSIVCEVQGLADPATQEPGVDEVVQGDHASVQSLAAKIISTVAKVRAEIAADLAPITSALNSVNSVRVALSSALGTAIAPLQALLVTLSDTVGGVASFATADLPTLAGVLQPLNDVQLCVGKSIMACEGTLNGAATVGGVAAGGRPSFMADSLLAHAAALPIVADLYDLHNLCGRLATNLTAIGSGGAVVTVAGANLFELAAQAYGDASEWVTIAKANGLTEPFLTGLRSLLIPPVSGRTGGVLKELIGSDQTAVQAVDAPNDVMFDFSNPDDAVWIRR